MAPSSAYVRATNRMITAPMIQEYTAPGPANWAARHAPNSQPDPMMEPKPVNISATAPTSRRIALSLDMHHSPFVDGCRPGGITSMRRSGVGFAAVFAAVSFYLQGGVMNMESPLQIRSDGVEQRFFRAAFRHHQVRGQCDARGTEGPDV